MHPVQFHAENVTPRSRLTTFFRLIMLIPHVIVLGLWGIVMYVVVPLAWLVILITGRNPFWGFTVSYLRYSARVNAYGSLISDAFPPFGSGGAYSAELTVQQPERHSRLTTFFRYILAIPAAILAVLLGYAGNAVAIIQWLVIVFTAKCPDGLHDFQALVQRFRLRTFCYMTLVTDRYPNFDNSPAPATGPDTVASGWDTGSSGGDW